MSDDNLLSDDPIVATEPTKPKYTPRRKKIPAKTRSSLPELGFYPLHELYELPKRATEQSSCLDVRANFKVNSKITVYKADNTKDERIAQYYESAGQVGVVINPNERVLVPTGFILDIPEGHSVRVHPRSGCSLKEGLTLINCEGVIDSDYVNEMFLPIVNNSVSRVLIVTGERYAQLEMVEDLKFETVELDVAPTNKTDRTGGFGHTGKK